MTDAVAEAPPAPTTLQKLVAEVLGTFVLVFFGCGSAVYAAMRDTFDIVAISLTFGFAVLVMIYAVGRISGGHFNPAVSVAAALGGRIPWREVPIYVAAQLGGAIAAGAALLGLMQGFEFYDVDRFGLGQNSFGDDGTGYALWAALILELLMTAIFVFVILAVTDARNEHPALAPLVIGFTLAAIHLVTISATGTSVNPARSIGPALFAGTDAIQQVWLFVVAPLVGAALAGLAYPAVFGHAGDPVPGSGFRFPARTSPAAVPGYGATDQYQQQWNQQAWSGEPIIQDGWQWDPYAQQWIPAPQPGAAPPAPPATPSAQSAPATPSAPAAPSGPAHAAPPAAPTGPITPGQPAGQDPDEGHTQIRPPQY